jgi:hypothetical protein
MGAFRAALAVAALTLLGACNLVMTKDPVFTKADAAGAPPLKPGVWRQDADASCPPFDESQPLAAWPACANGFVVKQDSVGAFQTQAGKTSWASTAFILASGSPRVLQIHLDASIGGSSLPPLYVYGAVEPTKLDADGKIVALTSWLVMCGEPPPADAKMPDGKSTRNGTLHPLPGLKMDDSANDCTTTSPDAIRGAAKASRQWTKPSDLTRDHWVRDGEK